MFDRYQDIIKAANKDPLWWDWSYVPRFIPFTPLIHGGDLVKEQVLLQVVDKTTSLAYVVAFADPHRGPNHIWERMIREREFSWLNLDVSFRVTHVLQYWMKDGGNAQFPWYRNPFREGIFLDAVGFTPNDPVDNWSEPIFVS